MFLELLYQWLKTPPEPPEEDLFPVYNAKLLKELLELGKE